MSPFLFRAFLFFNFRIGKLHTLVLRRDNLQNSHISMWLHDLAHSLMSI